MNEKEEMKETFGTKVKKFMLRNRRKFIIGGTVIGGTLLGGGILKKHLDNNNDSYIETVEEDYESIEYTGDPDESNDESSEE